MIRIGYRNLLALLIVFSLQFSRAEKCVAQQEPLPQPDYQCPAGSEWDYTPPKDRKCPDFEAKAVGAFFDETRGNALCTFDADRKPQQRWGWKLLKDSVVPCHCGYEPKFFIAPTPGQVPDIESACMIYPQIALAPPNPWQPIICPDLTTLDGQYEVKKDTPGPRFATKEACLVQLNNVLGKKCNIEAKRMCKDLDSQQQAVRRLYQCCKPSPKGGTPRFGF